MTGARLLRSRRARQLVLLLACIGVLTLLLLRGKGAFAGRLFGLLGGHDFVEYWSAARLLWTGGNPYDPGELMAVEQAVGWPEAEPLMIWNPPWTLALALPLAALPFNSATLVWLSLQLVLVLGSGALLWRFFAPGDMRYWIGMLLAAMSAPGLITMSTGQISLWLLAGVVVFLSAQRARHDLLAGGGLALLMIKPHAAYLFWLAALWWVWRSRRWRVLAGWLGTLLAASGIVLLFAPGIFGNYLAAWARTPLYWLTPTLGTWLRLLLDVEQQWLQLLPSFLGVLGLIVWLWRRRGPWRWQQVISPLLLASALTSSFAWITDHVLLLPVVVDLVARLRPASLARRLVVLGILVAFQVILFYQTMQPIGDHFAAWHPLALAGLYALSLRPDPEKGGQDIVQGAA